MKKETVFPLVVGLVLGAMVILFWQFGAQLGNQNSRLAQLEQATTANTKTVSDIVAFLNNATGANKTGQAPAATTPEVK